MSKTASPSTSKNSGFTFLECLVALLILNSILWLTLAVIQQSRQVNQLIERRKDQEFEIFLFQLANELEKDKFVAVSKNQIFVTRNSPADGHVHLRNNFIRLSVKSGNHELLTEVAAVTFTQEEQAVKIKVLFMNGEVRYGQWTIPKT